MLTTGSAIRTAAILLVIASAGSCGKQAPPDASSLDSMGSWTFVNYWAKWCKPCIKEIPELNRLHLREGVRVLGVNYDGAQGEDLQAELQSLDVQFPTLAMDPAARFGVDRPQVLPTTLVINPEGALMAVLVGPQTEESLLAVAGLGGPANSSRESPEQSGNE